MTAASWDGALWSAQFAAPAPQRLFPAVDVAASGTRRDDLLMPPEQYGAAGRLRRALAGLDPQQALEMLLAKTRDTSSNPEFLLQVQRSA